MITGDTIAAISTSATAPSARIIVRTSGSEAIRVAKALTNGATFDAGGPSRGTIALRGLAVPAWIYCFDSPRSYTGEDLIEFHVPGNAMLARWLLDDLIAHRGLRLAEAGEFTARAYFNGRLDLTEAEGVAATIAALSETELRAARQLLGGELSRRLKPIMDAIAQTLALIEVGIDFSDEDVSFLSAAEISEQLSHADAALAALVEQSARFESLAHEPQVVLVGRPNAGKSTLLNALALQDRAVVSPVAGTTRDAIWAEVILRRGMIRLIDVAGLDEARVPDDEKDVTPQSSIDLQMRAAALLAVKTADVVVLVREVTDASPVPALDREPDFTVYSKADLLSEDSDTGNRGLAVSAHTGLGLAELRERLDLLAFGASSHVVGTAGAQTLALNVRHRNAIDEARHHIHQSRSNLSPLRSELIALSLRETLDALGQVLGSLTPDELLGRIFANFCIGK